MVIVMNCIMLVYEIKIYRQCVGIHMGTDCATILANLFLFFLRVQVRERLDKEQYIEVQYAILMTL